MLFNALMSAHKFINFHEFIEYYILVIKLVIGAYGENIKVFAQEVLKIEKEKLQFY